MSIDLVVFRRFQDKAGPRFTCELVETFLFNASIMLTELKYWRRDKKHEAFVRTARTMRSGSMLFGAMQLSAIALDLEQNGIPEDDEKLERLRVEFASAKEELEDLCHFG